MQIANEVDSEAQAMVTPNDAHVVIGGAGGTGAGLVAELLKRGHRVRRSSTPS